MGRERVVRGEKREEVRDEREDVKKEIERRGREGAERRVEEEGEKHGRNNEGRGEKPLKINSCILEIKIEHVVVLRRF